VADRRRLRFGCQSIRRREGDGAREIGSHDRWFSFATVWVTHPRKPISPPFAEHPLCVLTDLDLLVKKKKKTTSLRKIKTIAKAKKKTTTTHQGIKVCVAILQTCAVCLMILMRHSSWLVFFAQQQHLIFSTLLPIVYCYYCYLSGVMCCYFLLISIYSSILHICLIFIFLDFYFLLLILLHAHRHTKV